MLFRIFFFTVKSSLNSLGSLYFFFLSFWSVVYHNLCIHERFGVLSFEVHNQHIDLFFRFSLKKQFFFCLSGAFTRRGKTCLLTAFLCTWIILFDPKIILMSLFIIVYSLLLKKCLFKLCWVFSDSLQNRGSLEAAG